MTDNWKIVLSSNFSFSIHYLFFCYLYSRYIYTHTIKLLYIIQCIHMQFDYYITYTHSHNLIMMLNLMFIKYPSLTYTIVFASSLALVCRIIAAIFAWRMRSQDACIIIIFKKTNL